MDNATKGVMIFLIFVIIFFILKAYLVKGVVMGDMEAIYRAEMLGDKLNTDIPKEQNEEFKKALRDEQKQEDKEIKAMINKIHKELGYDKLDDRNW